MEILKKVEKKYEENIGIITFHDAINYGALLQTYALQHWIKLNRL